MSLDPKPRLVVYESRLELARILLADFEPDVVGIAAQPLQLVGPEAGRIRRHVPDLLLVNGAQLYHRATPTQPMWPTPRGAALLQALAQPDIRVRGRIVRAGPAAPGGC